MATTTTDTARIIPAALKLADAAVYLGLAPKTLANCQLAGLGSATSASLGAHAQACCTASRIWTRGSR